MKDSQRTAVYDKQLQLEAFHFEGIVQPFPNHFHEHYVIGFVEQGQRTLVCNGQEYLLRPGSIVLFNPGDSHGCTQTDGGTFAYCGFNISKQTMLERAAEVTGEQILPGFSQNVLTDDELLCCLRSLHQMVLHRADSLEREERFLLLLSFCFSAAACPFPSARRNARTKGITPYRYLETVRINAAKTLLAQGVPPLEAALQTGFSDQSHFTHYFSSFIGLVPGVYREIFADTNKEEHTHEP